jgi:hypothetical protein
MSYGLIDDDQESLRGKEAADADVQAWAVVIEEALREALKKAVA